MRSDSNHHHWSGWPGAYCLKCGVEDPLEIALADNEYDPIDGKFISPEVEARTKERNICSVVGKLVWNSGKKGMGVKD